MNVLRCVAAAILLSAAVAFADPTATPTCTPQAADATKYGECPKDYMVIVKEWLGDQLLDAGSAIIEFTSEPKPTELPLRDGSRVAGYLVEFKVNSRNRFGAYTGFQKHGALIRNGEVVRGTGFGY